VSKGEVENSISFGCKFPEEVAHQIGSFHRGITKKTKLKQSVLVRCMSDRLVGMKVVLMRELLRSRREEDNTVSAELKLTDRDGRPSQVSDAYEKNH